MSFDNRQEDVNKILALKVGEDYCFNIFQEGGACVTRVGFDFELEEIPIYGGEPKFDCTFKPIQAWEIVDMVYDEWT